MFFKFGVKYDGAMPMIWYSIGVAEEVHVGLFRKDLVVTSLLDGKHSENSLHYSGNAVDFRTRHLTADKKRLFYLALRNRLERIGYDVVEETDHIHVEWDAKDGEQLFHWVD